MRGKSYRFLLLLTLLCCMPLTVQAAKKEVKVKKVTLNQKSLTLYVGSSRTLKATFQPQKTTQKKVVWSSSNGKVASVTQKGVVKAKKKGTATITVKVRGTNKKARCKVTVKSLPKCSDTYKGKDKIKHKDVVISKKTATCSDKGYLKYKCTRCGKIRTVNVKKTNHNYQVIKTTPSTCTKKGSTTKKCKNCGNVNTTESDYTHAYQEVIEKQPTCKAEGSRISKCKDCGKIRYREAIKKLSHNTSPIEESETYTISECKVCKDRILDYHDKEFTIKFKDGTTKTVVGHYEPYMEQEMFRLLNEYRVKNGLKALELGDNDLREKARIRAREIAVFDSHNRPDGGKWGYVGENLACRPRNCEQAMNGFVDSEIHNNRMLNEFYEINYSAVFAVRDSITNLYFYYYIQAFNYDS